MERFGQPDEKSCPFAKMMSPGKWGRLTGIRNDAVFKCWVD